MIENEINIIIMLYFKIQLVLDNNGNIAISLCGEAIAGANLSAVDFFLLAAEVMAIPLDNSENWTRIYEYRKHI